MLMEEELQNSMATSEEDAEFEEDDELAADMNADAYAANNQLHNGMAGAQSEGDEDEDDEEEEEEEEGDEEDLTDEDAEGEEDDEMADQPNVEEEDESEEDDEDGDEDGEGVGAVKIQPGLLEDDDEDAVSGSDDEEEESAASADDDDESKDSTDAEVEVEWEPTAEEEEEPANPNRCMWVSFAIEIQGLVIDNFTDSVNRTKRMIPVKNLSSIWLVVSVEIMVCLSKVFRFLARLTRL